MCKLSDTAMRLYEASNVRVTFWCISFPSKTQRSSSPHYVVGRRAHFQDLPSITVKEELQAGTACAQMLGYVVMRKSSSL